MNQTNPWKAWAANEATQLNNNITWDGSTLALNLANGLPSNFWTKHLQAIDPCVIQRTC